MRIIKSPSVAAWTPFDRLAPWRDLLDNAFALAGTSGNGWAPALDVYEDDEQVTVKVELAGMKKEDFDIALEDDTLKVSGHRKVEADDRQGESFRSERFFGSFSRSITLPSPVKADAVKATYQDGILTIALPKAEEAKPRKIEVHLN